MLTPKPQKRLCNRKAIVGCDRELRTVDDIDNIDLTDIDRTPARPAPQPQSFALRISSRAIKKDD
jgi:hypothetical protein